MDTFFDFFSSSHDENALIICVHYNAPSVYLLK